MSAMTHERTTLIRRRQVRKIVRVADRAGRKVARRNARLAAEVAPNLLPEQAVAVIAAAVANSAIEAPESSESSERRSSPMIVAASTRRPSRRGVIRSAIVAGVLVIATASTLTTADMRQTHAWFTARQVTTGNTVTAAVVKVAGVGPAIDPGAKLSVANLLPLSDADAADPTRGVFLDLTVRNTGSVPIDWTLALTGVRSTAGAVDLGAITNVSYSVAGGVWSPAQRLDAPLSVSGRNLSPGTVGNTTPVRLRFWLDKTAGNEAQGAVASFTTDLQAIQTGAS